MLRRVSESVVVIGAGPYGLSAAAHLRQVGVETRVFGHLMQFWREQMPVGMLLRSRVRSSHIADPKQVLKLDDFARATDRHLSTPVTREEFVEYGRWFQRQAIPDVDARLVRRVEPDRNGCFRLVLEDGESRLAGRVVIAGGIASFAWRPAAFDALPPALVSHTYEHTGFDAFRGRCVLVVGGGQSALESAALLHEAGARVEVLARAARVRWLSETSEHSGACWPLLHPPPTGVGGRVLGWIVAAPDLFRRMPVGLKQQLWQTYRPAGASWLRARLADVSITTGRMVATAVRRGDQVCVHLDDGALRRVDHVLLGTGYQVDVARYEFLAPELLRSLQLVDGYPLLGAGLESSVPGVHFLGAPAAMSFGPIMRFVVGTWYAAPALARRVLGKPQPIVSVAFARGAVNRNSVA